MLEGSSGREDPPCAPTEGPVVDLRTQQFRHPVESPVQAGWSRNVQPLLGISLSMQDHQGLQSDPAQTPQSSAQSPDRGGYPACIETGAGSMQAGRGPLNPPCGTNSYDWTPQFQKPTWRILASWGYWGDPVARGSAGCWVQAG